MADLRKYVQDQEHTLAGSGVVTGDVVMTLSSFNQINGTPLTMADFGSKGFGTIEPNTSREEQISFTGIIDNGDGTQTLTGISNVSFVYPYTATSGVQQTHAGRTVFIISNNPGLYDGFANKLNDETIAETWTFTNTDYPRIDDCAVLPTIDEEFTPKCYVDAQDASILSQANSFTTQLFNNVSSGGAGELSFEKSFEYTVQNPATAVQTAYQDSEKYIANNGTVLKVDAPNQAYQSYDVTADFATATDIFSYVAIGEYLYLLIADTTAGPDHYEVWRYTTADLSLGGTQITFAGAFVLVDSNNAIRMTSNGTDFYFNYFAGNTANDYEISRFTLSGTVLTYANTVSLGALNAGFIGLFVIQQTNILAYDVVTNIFRRFTSGGSLLDTYPAMGNLSNETLLNWEDRIYITTVGTGGSMAYRLSFVEDPTQPIGRVQNYVAAQDLVAGDKVGVSEGIPSHVALAWKNFDSFTLPFFNVSPGIIDIAEIATDKFVLVYANSLTYLVVVTIDRDTLSVSSVGTPVVLPRITAGQYIREVAITEIDTDKFAIIYTGATNNICNLIAGTVSGITITLGSPVTYSLGNGLQIVQGQAITKLDTDKVACFSNHSGGLTTDGVAVVTFSGTTPTIGIFQNAPSPTAALASLVQITTDKFIVAQGAAGGGVGTTVYNVVGFVATPGVTQLVPFANLLTGSLDTLRVLSPTLVAIMNKFNSPEQSEMIMGSIGASTVTYGAPLLLPSTNLSGPIFQDTASTLMVYGTENNRVTFSGITPTTSVATGYGFSPTYIASSNFPVQFGGDGTSFIGRASFSGYGVATHNFIGIVLENASAGDPVQVLIKGGSVANNQIGLIPGQQYFLLGSSSGQSGAMTLVTGITAFFGSVANVANYVGEAISETSIKF